MVFEVKLEKFSGPLEKLLELIEERRLEITDVSLAAVTDDFLTYIDSLKEEPPDLRFLADFISVASKLLFIKSKLLLPHFALSEEEEADIKDLEGRLALYRALRPMLALVRERWRSGDVSFSRQFLLERGGFPAGTGFFYPGGATSADALVSALVELFQHLAAFTFETETIKEKIVSIEEKIREILLKLEEGISSFKSLSEKKERGEITAIFLAVLHLARDELVRLEQAEHFSDILITPYKITNS